MQPHVNHSISNLSSDFHGLIPYLLGNAFSRVSKPPDSHAQVTHHDNAQPALGLAAMRGIFSTFKDRTFL